METMQGRILKNYNGYYYVKVDGVEAPYTCKVKGRMKKNRFSMATGDLVQFTPGEDGKGEGMIEGVLPRKNYLLRPTLANLDVFAAVFACATPDFSYLLADKLLALAQLGGIPAILVLNKSDLAPDGLIDDVRATYERLGYEVYAVCAARGEADAGIRALRERLRGCISAFGGPSGVGKSSTLNAIDSTVDLRTGEVSEKIGRGKHTTRFAELLPFDDGYLADTPGFGNLLLEGLEEDQAVQAFREFREYEDDCKYRSCSHTHEPVCGVKAAVERGDIARTRYESYLAMREEIKELVERERKYR